MRIGQAVKTITKPTASPPSAVRWQGEITAPTTDRQCAELEALAATLPHSEPAASAEEIARNLEFLSAALPSRNIDAETAKMRFTVYVRLLAGHSKSALAYMAQRACAELDWFPTPHQCLTFLRDYAKPVSQRDVALQLVSQYRTHRFDGWMSQFADGSMTELEMTGAPERWKRIAVERGFLRYGDDGGFIIRELRAL